jgi:hypothetical protein
MTGRHHALDDGCAPSEAHPELVATLRDWYASIPVPAVPARYAEPARDAAPTPFDRTLARRRLDHHPGRLPEDL